MNNSRCQCSYAGVAPTPSAPIIKNGFLIHTYTGAQTCEYLPGDVIMTGVVIGRTSIPDQNQSSWTGLN